MSDNLADLATWLPSQFLTGGMDDKALFLNTHNRHHVPYDFASVSSTESESDDDDVSGLTRGFTRSVSLQERLKILHPVEKNRGFFSSPESAFNLNASRPTQVRSSPTTLFGQADGDSWDLVYAAVRQVARMGTKMNAVNDAVFANRGLLGAPRHTGAPASHRYYLPNYDIRSKNEEFAQNQQLRQRVAGGANYDCGGRCGTRAPVGFRQSAWPPLPVETQRHQEPQNEFVSKPVLTGFSGGCGRGIASVKTERAGTGVFLPRNYSNVPSEPKKKPACSSIHLPAGAAHSFNKNMDPIVAPQPSINGGLAPRYQLPPSSHPFKRDELTELVIARRNTMMLAQQRRSTTHVGARERRTGQPDVVLPQEWTY